MKRFDKFLSVAVLGTLAPVVLMLFFWWGSLPFIHNNDLLIFTLSALGFAAGIALDFTLLRRFVKSLFALPFWALAAILIFYSIMIYGFFMGFPVPNSLVGVVGVYIAVRQGLLRHSAAENTRQSAKRILRLSTAVLFLLCVSTAYLSLRESSICTQVKGMLNLPFDVTMGMIWALILIGGSGLLLFQYGAAKLVSCKMLKTQN